MDVFSKRTWLRDICKGWKEAGLVPKKKKDGTYYEDKALSSSKEVPNIPQSYKPSPAGNKDSKIAPKDMPDNGHHPNYKS